MGANMNRGDTTALTGLRAWRAALSEMPRLDRDTWDRLDGFARWLVACRASVLVMTFSSAAVGGVLAWRDQAFLLGHWLLAAVGLVLAHATNNLINDLTDVARGVDDEGYFRVRYGTHVLQQGLLDRRGMLRYTLLTGLLALLAGAALVWLRGGVTLPLMAAGAALVLFYTWPLKYIGLGEPAVLLAWGPLMVGGTYFVCSGRWDWPVAAVGTVYALGPTSVLFGKHIDKLSADAAKGVRTLPVLLGEARARHCVILLLVAQYGMLCWLAMRGHLGLVSLLALVNLPVFGRLLKVYRAPAPAQCPADFPASAWPLWFSAYAFDHTRRFSGWLLLGLLLDAVLVRFSG